MPKRKKHPSGESEPSAKKFAGEAIPKKLNFVVVGQLPPEQAKYLKIWKGCNSDYQIKLWWDRNTLLEPLKHKVAVDETYKQVAAIRDKIFAAEPFTKKFHYTQNTINHKLDRVGSVSRTTDVASLLTREYGVTVEQVNEINSEQNRIYQALIDDGFIIHTDFDELYTVADRERDYNRQAFDLNNFEQAEQLVGNWVLQKEGGVLADTKTLPAPNHKIFKPIQDQLRKVPEKDRALLERAKVQLLEQRQTQEVLKGGLSQTAKDSGNIDFLEQIKDRGYPDVAEALKRRVTNTRKSLFLPLGELTPPEKSQLILGGKPDYHPDKPMLIAAQATSPVLPEVEGDYRFYAKLRNQYKKLGTNPATEAEEKWESKTRSKIDRHFKTPEDKKVLSSAEMEGALNSIKLLYDESIRPGSDPAGVSLGYRAYSIRQRTIGLPKAITDQYQRQLAYSVDTGQIAQHPAGGYVPESFIRGRGYDNQIIVTLDNDPEILAGDAGLFKKDPSHSYWLLWDYSTRRLAPLEGTAIAPGPNTRVVISGHGSGKPGERRVGGFGPEELVTEVLLHLAPAGSHMRRLVICACRPESKSLGLSGEADPKNSFAASVLLQAKEKGVKIDSLTAVNKRLSVDFFGRKFSLFEVGGKPGMMVNKPELTRYEFFLKPDGSVGYLTKAGQPWVQYSFQKTGLKERTSIMDAYLQPSKSMRDFSQTHIYRGQGGALLPADTSALAYGMSEARGDITVAETAAERVEGIKGAVYLAGQASSAQEWLTKIGEHWPEARGAVATTLGQHSDQDAALRRLQQRSFQFLAENPLQEEGAAVINALHPGPFASIHLPSRPAEDGACNPSASSISKREACDPDTEQQAREKTTRDTILGVTLLSDEHTLILPESDDGSDIAISQVSEQWLAMRQGIDLFRRNMAATTLAEKRGHHNIIALEASDLEAARTLVRNEARSGIKGRAVLYDRDNNLLLTRHGRVIPLLPGKEANSLSLVSSASTLAALTDSDLVSLVKDFCRGGTIGKLQLLVKTGSEEQGTDDMDALVKKLGGDHPELDAVTRLTGVRTIQPDTGKTGPLTGRFPGETRVVAMPGIMDLPATEEQPDQWGQQHKSGVNPVQQETAEQARLELTEKWQSVAKDDGLQMAAKLHELAIELDSFKSTLANHGLSEFDVPLLGTLEPVQDNASEFQLAVYNKTTDKVRYLTLDQRSRDNIQKFRRFYDEKLTTIQVASADEIEPGQNMEAEGAEFIDGVGWAFATQTFMKLLADGNFSMMSAADDRAMNSVMKNALEAHGWLNLFMVGRVSGNAVLDVGKYLAALRTGEVISLPERLSARIMKRAETLIELGETAGTLTAIAKGVKYFGAAMDTLVGLASMGLDITELVEAGSPEQKALAGTQLAFDTISTTLGLVSLGASIAGAASVATVMSGVGVIVGGLAIGITGLISVTEENIGSFKQGIKLFDKVGDDLELVGVINDDKKLINLDTVPDGDQHRLRLAPIKAIDLSNRIVTFGQIYLPKVAGGSGTPGIAYVYTGPTIDNKYHHGVNGLGRFQSTRTLPETNYKTLVLPAIPDWQVDGWDDQVIPGAVTRWNNHKGLQYLSSFEGENFAFNWVLNILVPLLFFPIDIPLEYGLYDMKSVSSKGNVNVKIDLAAEDWIFITPTVDHKRVNHFTFNSQGGSQTLFLATHAIYTINLYQNPDPKKAQPDQWTLIAPSGSGDQLRFSNGKLQVNGIQVAINNPSSNSLIVALDGDKDSYQIDTVAQKVIIESVDLDTIPPGHGLIQEIRTRLKDYPHARFVGLTESFHQGDIGVYFFFEFLLSELDFTTNVRKVNDPLYPRPTEGAVSPDEFTIRYSQRRKAGPERAGRYYQMAPVKYWYDTALGDQNGVVLHKSYKDDGRIPERPWRIYGDPTTRPGYDLPSDIEPLAGDLRHGYYFYSPTTKELYADFQYRFENSQKLPLLYDNDRLYLKNDFLDPIAHGLRSGRPIGGAFHSLNIYLKNLDSVLLPDHHPRFIDLNPKPARAFQYWYDSSAKVQAVLMFRPKQVFDGVVPVTDDPEGGYFFYQPSGKRLFFDSQKPAKHSGAVQSGFYYKSLSATSDGRLLAYSTTGVHYLVSAENNQINLVPFSITTASAYKAIDEILQLPASEAHNLIPLLQPPEPGKKAASVTANADRVGFYDRAQNTLPLFDLSSSLFPSGSSQESLEKDVQPVLRMEADSSVYYVFHFPKIKQLLVSNITRQAPEASDSLRIILDPPLTRLYLGKSNEWTPEVPYAFASGKGTILAIASDGLVLELPEGLLVPSLERGASTIPSSLKLALVNQQAPARGGIVGISRHILQGQNISDWRSQLSALMSNVSDRFMQSSANGLPVVYSKKIVSEEGGYEGGNSALNVSLNASDIPLNTSRNTSGPSGSDASWQTGIWYIRSLAAVIYGKGLQFLGLETDTQNALAFNANRSIVLYNLTSQEQKENPEPEPYNPDQVSLVKAYSSSNRGVTGSDSLGRVFTIGRHNQSMTGIDLRNTSLSVTPFNGLPGQSVSSLAQSIAGIAAELVNKTLSLAVGLDRMLSVQLPSQLPSQLSNDYAWYDTEEQLVRLFRVNNSGMVNNDRNTIRILGINTENHSALTLFFNTRTGNLYFSQNYRQQYRQQLVGSFDDARWLGNVLYLLGTNGDDQFVTDDFVDTRPLSFSSSPETADSQLQLYMEGKTGRDLYQVSSAVLRYFSEVVINIQVPGSTRSANQAEPGSHRLIKMDDFNAYEFSGNRQGQDLVLIHWPSGHYLVVKNAWPESTAYGGLPVDIQFRDDLYALADMQQRIFASTTGTLNLPLTLPLNLSSTGQRTTISIDLNKAPAYVQLLINGTSAASPEISFQEDDLVLSVTTVPGQVGTELRLVDFRYWGYAHGNIWFTGPQQKEYRLFQFDNYHYSADAAELYDITLPPDKPLYPGIQGERLWMTEGCITGRKASCSQIVKLENAPLGYPLIPRFYRYHNKFDLFKTVISGRYSWAASMPPDQKLSFMDMMFYGVLRPEDITIQFDQEPSDPSQLLCTVSSSQWPARTGIVSRASGQLGITLVGGQQDSDAIRRYIAVPFRAETSQLIQYGGEWRWGDEQNHISLAPAKKEPGRFILESDFVRGLLLNSLPGREGIYFPDQLKSVSAVHQYLSKQPVTIVKTMIDTESGQFKATGNEMNNLIPVNIDTTANYKVAAGGGDDVIIIRAPAGGVLNDWRQGKSRKKNRTPVDNSRLVLWERQMLSGKFEVHIDPGSGSNIIDLRVPVQARVESTTGSQAIILSRYSNANLTNIRDGQLFFSGIDYSEIAIEKTGSRFKLSYSPSGREIATLKSKSARVMVFSDGKQIDKPADWLQGLKEPASITTEPPVSQPASLEEDYTLSVVESLSAARHYIQRSAGEPVADNNTAFDGLEQSLAQLIQEMSVFQGQKSQGLTPEPPTMASVLPRTLVSPHQQGIT